MASTGLQEDNEAIVHTSPQVLTIEMLPVPEASSSELLLPLNVEEGDYMTRTSCDADVIFDHEFVVPFPDPVSTLNIHGSSRSDQGVQGTSSSEQMVLRAASSVNPSEIVHEGGVQSLNVSFGGSTFNTPLANNPTTGQNPTRHLFNDPYEYELEKIRIEEENLKKSAAEMTSQLMAELDRKMAEARSEFDRESQEFDAASKAKVMEVEAHMSLVQTASLLANAFVSKCSERSASNDLAAVRAMIYQHSTQQQQAVQTNTHISLTAPPRVRPQQEVQANAHISTSAPPRPSVIAVEDSIPNSSGPLSLVPRRTTSQQTVQAAHTHVNSTAPPPPSVTAVEPQTPIHLRPLGRFPRLTTTQPSAISQQAVAQSNTNVNSTALARLSVTTEALPLHSPLSNTPRPRPRPVISNLTPSSSPPVHGAVRGPTPHLVRAQPPHLARGQAPHLVRGPPPHLRRYVSTPAPMTAAGTTTHQRRSVQEQEQQQQGKSNDGLVHLSDED